MSGQYLFKSERLGFRAWQDADTPLLAAINADPEVMEFFPGLTDYAGTEAFIGRMQKQLVEKGFCYFAVDTLEDGAFIGFIGLSVQTFEASFTPCVDIGWRLGKKDWGNGYAAEGAKACLIYAFNALQIAKVYAVAPVVNLKSVQVMKKIGMKRVAIFTHPLLAGDERLRECVVYEIEA